MAIRSTDLNAKCRRLMRDLNAKRAQAGRTPVRAILRTDGPPIIIPTFGDGRTTHTPGKMNKWETLYAERLRVQMAAGEVRRFYFEAVKFRLAEGCWYCPDFLVELADGSWEVHEVKGYWRDDAKVKCKVMAEAFPFPLIIVSKGKGMAVWQYERIKARTGAPA